MHRAALAAADPAFAREELPHHAEHIGSFGQAVPVTTMGGQQKVVFAQASADARGHRLLTDRRMDGAQRQTFFFGPDGQLFKDTYALHEAVGLQQPRQVEIAARARRGGIHSLLAPYLIAPNGRGSARKASPPCFTLSNTGF